MHEELIYTDRRGSDCLKWDGLAEIYGESDLTPLWIADMDFKVPQSVRKALADWAEFGVFGYYKQPDAFHDSFMNWERTRHGYDVRREWLRFSPGLVTAAFWMTQVFSKPGDGVALLLPVYYPFFSAIEKSGRRIVGSHLINKGGVYTIDFEDFERRIAEEKATLFILCSPHNPVGRVWERWELEKLDEICRRHHVVIVSDEIHGDLVLGSKPHIPMGTIGDGRAITTTSATKTFNLAGLQNSTLIIPDDEQRAKFDAYAEAHHLAGGNMAGYIATRAAYEGGLPWLNAILRQVGENYAIVKSAAEKIPGAVLSPLEGTYLAWLDLTACIPQGQTKAVIQDQCRLAVNLGQAFGGPTSGGIYDRFIRLNLATSADIIQSSCKNLVDVLGKA